MRILITSVLCCLNCNFSGQTQALSYWQGGEKDQFIFWRLHECGECNPLEAHLVKQGQKGKSAEAEIIKEREDGLAWLVIREMEDCV